MKIYTGWHAYTKGFPGNTVGRMIRYLVILSDNRKAAADIGQTHGKVRSKYK